MTHAVSAGTDVGAIIVGPRPTTKPDRVSSRSRQPESIKMPPPLRIPPEVLDKVAKELRGKKSFAIISRQGLVGSGANPDEAWAKAAPVIKAKRISTNMLLQAYYE